jgi:hypothetical protein
MPILGTDESMPLKLWCETVATDLLDNRFQDSFSMRVALEITCRS